MDLVTIVNKNDFAFEQKFEGKVYAFPPSEPVTVPERTAGFFFAYGKTDEDRYRIMVRNGWIRKGGDEAKAKEILGNFTFSVGEADEETVKAEKRKTERVFTGIAAMSEAKVANDDGGARKTIRYIEHKPQRLPPLVAA